MKTRKPKQTKKKVIQRKFLIKKKSLSTEPSAL